jgi:hypothetical protein
MVSGFRTPSGVPRTVRNHLPRRCAVPPLQPCQIKEKVASAINGQDLRKSIRVMNGIHEAHEPMHDLPRTHLEALRDALLEMSKDRTGPRGAPTALGARDSPGARGTRRLAGL